jgi:hypothetical protein
MCFFYRSLGCALDFLTHTSLLQISLHHAVILHAHKLLPMTSASPIAPLHGSVLPLEPLCLPLHFLLDPCLFKRPLSHALQLLVFSFFFKGSLHIAQKLLLLEKHQTLEGDGVPSLYFHLVVDPSLHHARSFPLSSPPLWVTTWTSTSPFFFLFLHGLACTMLQLVFLSSHFFNKSRTVLGYMFRTITICTEHT